MPPDFNWIARPYRWLEYLTLGPLLQRCRLHFLPRVLHTRRALVLGDGDGRFLAQLLASNPLLHADAVDLSPAMLHLLRKRTHAAVEPNLTTHQINALAFQPSGHYDLVATHFFLDCLTQPELDRLTTRLARHLTPAALWLLSDFRIPPAGPFNLPARVFVRVLYLAFRLLTGLRTTRLPDHASSLCSAGLAPIATHHALFGILTTEIWQRHPSAPPSHPTLSTRYTDPEVNPPSRPEDLTRQELPMTTPSPISPFPTPPSPVPDVPASPGTDLPTGPLSDPIPDPEPPSPSLLDTDPAATELLPTD